MRNLLFISILATAIFAGFTTSNALAGEIPEASGPYLGQPLPGGEAALFAPGIVSTGMMDRDVSMSPDGREMYFGRMAGGAVVILYSFTIPRRVNSG